MVKMYGSTRAPQEEMPLEVVKYNPNKSEEYPPELEKLLKNPYDEDWSSTFWNEVMPNSSIFTSLASLLVFHYL